MSNPATAKSLRTPYSRLAHTGLIIACGAIARELKVLLRAPELRHLALVCLPAELHNRPERIPEAVREVVSREENRYERLFVAYADCGTGGQLDRVLAEFGIDRLPGAHCYEFFAGSSLFASLHEEEPGTFYLTDFLVRHFERLVVEGLGLDRHPQLLTTYFGNYKRVVYLAQQPTPALEGAARDCAERLGLRFEMRTPGLLQIARSLESLAREPQDPVVEP
jgi:hypothetical protein